MDTQARLGTKIIRVWDWPIRIFHWSVAALFFISWISAEIGGNAMQYHLWSGYAILGLVLFRVLWGWVGSETARFTHFIRAPGAVLAYARAWFKPGYRAALGHNPLGGWSVAALLFALAVQTLTGLFSNDDIANEGPLYHLVSKATSDSISRVHEGAFNVLLTLVALHLVAIVLYRVKHGENLVRPMLTGEKEVNENVPEPRQSSGWRALVLAMVVAGVVYGVVAKL
ncbi:MAG: cytochrome b/b6 domain-containing protein [Burkholderiales bacterium]|nr:cytochrome b/b6 domain-containing protein [Burkholderiales bacterium]